MTTVQRPRCRSRALATELGYAICPYCPSTFVHQGKYRPTHSTNIALESDITGLLRHVKSTRAAVVATRVWFWIGNQEVLKISGISSPRSQREDQGRLY